MAHKKYKTTESQIDYNNFSNLQAQCKSASKKFVNEHIKNIQISLTSNPTKFWNYVRNKGKCIGIPEEMHLENKHVSGPQISAFFGSYFSSVYKTPNTKPSDLNNLSINQYSHLPSNVSLSLEDISEGLNSLSKSDSKEPDGIAASLVMHLNSTNKLMSYILIFRKHLTQLIIKH